MKINPLEWKAIDHETPFEASGVLQLRSSAPFGLSLQALGVETAIGHDTAFRVPLPEASQVIIAGATAPVYMKTLPSRLVRMKGEKFTNIDRLPQESGTVAEVTKALRLMKLEQRAIMRAIREERASLDASRAKTEEAVIEDDPAPEPEEEASQ